MITIDSLTEIELKQEWLERLRQLIKTVQDWAMQLGWSTRLIDKRMEDSRLGNYRAPAILLQFETTRVLLEPVARFAPGTEGTVDLYLMPAYDDIASIYFLDGSWHMEYVYPGATVPNCPDASCAFTKESFCSVLDAMRSHDARPV